MNFVHLFMRNMTGKQYCQTTNFALFNTFFSFFKLFFLLHSSSFCEFTYTVRQIMDCKKTKLFSLPSVWEWAIPAYHVHAVSPVLKC